MTTGTKSYNGLGVPLLGESEIIGQTAATDILTITGASSQSGDYLILRDTNEAELLVVESEGDINLKKHADHTSFAALNLALLSTFPTSAAGCVTGDLFMIKVTTDVYCLGLCASGAASTFYRSRRAVIDVTLGSAS